MSNIDCHHIKLEDVQNRIKQIEHEMIEKNEVYQPKNETKEFIMTDGKTLEYSVIKADTVIDSNKILRQLGASHSMRDASTMLLKS